MLNYLWLDFCGTQKFNYVACNRLINHSSLCIIVHSTPEVENSDMRRLWFISINVHCKRFFIVFSCIKWYATGKITRWFCVSYSEKLKFVRYFFENEKRSSNKKSSGIFENYKDLLGIECSCWWKVEPLGLQLTWQPVKFPESSLICSWIIVCELYWQCVKDVHSIVYYELYRDKSVNFIENHTIVSHFTYLQWCAWTGSCAINTELHSSTQFPYYWCDFSTRKLSYLHVVKCVIQSKIFCW